MLIENNKQMQNILNKLAKIQKAQPKKSKFTQAKPMKVNLSAVENLSREIERIQDHLSLASYYAYERFPEIVDEILDFNSKIMIEVDNQAVNSNVAYTTDQFMEVDEILQRLDKTADEFGIAVDQIPEYNEAVELREQYEEVYNDYVKAYQEVRTQANDGIGLMDFL